MTNINPHWWNGLAVEEAQGFRDGLCHLMDSMRDSIINQDLAKWRQTVNRCKKAPITEVSDLIAVKRKILTSLQEDKDARADEWQKGIEALEAILTQRQNEHDGELFAAEPPIANHSDSSEHAWWYPEGE